VRQSLVSRQSGETHVDNVVEEAVLRDSSNSRSVVGAGVDRRHSVGSSWEAIRNCSAEDATDSRVVQTLEEREIQRVEDCRRVNGSHLLNNNATGTRISSGFNSLRMGDVLLGMRYQDVLPIELLRCSKVAVKVMSEESSMDAINITYFCWAFVKNPVSRFWTAIVAVNAWFAGTVPKFSGKVNFDVGILASGIMSPIGTGLQEPSRICCPFVMVWPMQKLMLVNDRVRRARLTTPSHMKTAKGH